MAKVMRVFAVIYGLVFVLMVLIALLSLFGAFSHQYMDPGM